MRYAALLLPLLLSACTDASVGLLATARQAFGPTQGVIDNAQLDPRYRYLRVVHRAGISGMVLGPIETTPSGPVEVWYASDGALLRIQNGRLAGNTGLQREWRRVVLPQLPSWPDLAARKEPFRWERERDVMPGYRYAVRDTLVVSMVPAPSSTKLVGVDPGQLIWFEERTESSTEEALPAAHYAVQGDHVVYAEQCVAPDRCFSWQRWPAGS